VSSLRFRFFVSYLTTCVETIIDAISSRSCFGHHAFRISSSSYINSERNANFNVSSTVVIIRRMVSDLPHHLVVGMPALSPTMVSGTVSEWKIEEGSAFQAGDSIAEIQTDKASIAFEAQDDGYIAKHLVPAGTEVNVGEPIMVTVEDEEYVKAFAGFALPPPSSAAATTKAQQEVSKGETPKGTVTIPPPQVLPPPVSAAIASPPPPLTSAPSVSVPPPPPPNAPSTSLLNDIAASSLAVSTTPSWGKLAKSSPIAKILRASQQNYIDSYGVTGQKPL